MEFHPSAAMFPLLELDSEEFTTLVDSIRKHGLREPIRTHEGKILDGRNRMTACTVAKVAPRFEEADVNGSVADYVYDLNFHRRHLSDGAKQLAAGRYKEEAAKEAKERMKQGGEVSGRGREKGVADSPPPIARAKARDVAAAKFNVKPKAVDAAAKVLKSGAVEVIKAVESGKLKVTTAARLVAAPKAVQAKAVKEGNSAVRAVIQQHAPSLKDEARNDPGVKWHKAMEKVRVILLSTRDLGGISQLVRSWTPELIEQYHDDIGELIEELEKWKRALSDKLAKH